MDTEVRVRLEKLYETMHTEGWDVLVEDLEHKIKLIKDELVTNTNVDGDVLRIAQGRVMAYNDIISLIIIVSNLINEPDEDEDDGPTV